MLELSQQPNNAFQFNKGLYFRKGDKLEIFNAGAGTDRDPLHRDL